MLDLAPETEALALSLAEARHVSVDAAVRSALEAQRCLLSTPKARDTSPEAVAARRMRIDQIVAEVAALPILDDRPIVDIVDDINTL